MKTTEKVLAVIAAVLLFAIGFKATAAEDPVLFTGDVVGAEHRLLPPATPPPVDTRPGIVSVLASSPDFMKLQIPVYQPVPGIVQFCEWTYQGKTRMKPEGSSWSDVLRDFWTSTCYPPVEPYNNFETATYVLDSGDMTIPEVMVNHGGVFTMICDLAFIELPMGEIIFFAHNPCASTVPVPGFVEPPFEGDIPPFFQPGDV